MSFSTVPTVAPGDAWSAAQHNTYLRDNMAAIWVGGVAGDLDYYTSATTKARLAIGAAARILKSSGAAPVWDTIAAVLQASAMIAAQAAGDLFYGISASAIGRLPIGTANKILSSTGAAPTWSTLAALAAVQAIVASQAAGDVFYGASASAIARLAKPAVDSLLFNDAAGAVSWLAANHLPGRLVDSDFVTFTPDADYGALADVAGATLTLTIPGGTTATILLLSSLTAYANAAAEGFATTIIPYIDGVAQSSLPFIGSETSQRNQPITLLARKAAVATGARVCKLRASNAGGASTHITQGYLLGLAFVE